MLLLVRHGQTDTTARGVYASTTEALPTDTGIEQEHAVGAWIRHNFGTASSILTSPRKRTRSLASTLETYLSGPEHRVVPQQRDGLRELDFGRFEGRSISELKAEDDFGRWRTIDSRPVTPEGVESFDSAAKRYSAELDGVGRGDNEVVVVCGHSYALRSWIALSVLGMNNPNLLQLDAGSVTGVDFRDSYPRLSFVNIRPSLSRSYAASDQL